MNELDEKNMYRVILQLLFFLIGFDDNTEYEIYCIDADMIYTLCAWFMYYIEEFFKVKIFRIR